MSSPRPGNRTVPATLLFLLAAVSPPLLSAQRVPLDSTFVLPSSSPVPQQSAFRPPTAAGILGGTLGSAVGMVGGGLVGYGMATCSESEFLCGLGEAAVGALIGSVVGSAVGANLGARRGGASPSFRATALAATGGLITGLVGGYLGGRLDPEGFGPLIGFTLGQGALAGLIAASQR